MRDDAVLELYDGSIIVINRQLLSHLAVDNNINDIKQLHYEKSMVLDMIGNANDCGELQLYAGFIQEIEFELQDLWGFKRNANFHRFWKVPKCTCPKLDNEDFYSTKYSIVRKDCPIHGGR